jgi:hypothetical protein
MAKAEHTCAATTRSLPYHKWQLWNYNFIVRICKYSVLCALKSKAVRQSKKPYLQWGAYYCHMLMIVCARVTITASSSEITLVR